MSRVRLRLLNDYELVLAGLQAMLAPYSDRITVVEVDIRDTADRNVDVTLLDTFAKGQAHRPYIDEYLADPAAGAMVVYSWNTSESLIFRSLEKGCRGYIDKTVGSEELVDALTRISDGETVVALRSARARAFRAARLGAGATSGIDAIISSSPTRSLNSSDSAAEALMWPGQELGLTLREAEIVALIATGRTNPEIAEMSFISGNTLKGHIRSAYRKMGVQRRSQAVRWGIEHGIVQ